MAVIAEAVIAPEMRRSPASTPRPSNSRGGARSVDETACVASTPRAVAPDGSPVALYLKLDGAAEAAFIHQAIPDGSSVLELGAGAGRVTRHLARAGHAVTAVDNSQAMLDQLEALVGVEPVLADLCDLDLSPRRWPVVLLASHLVNDVDGRRFLVSAARHAEPGGTVLVQRHEPGWIDRVEPYVSRRPGLDIGMRDIERPGPGVLSATMVFRIEGEQYEQRFTAYEVDDARMAAFAADAGCEIVDVLGEHQKWIRLRRIDPTDQ